MTPGEFDDWVETYTLSQRRWDERCAWIIGQLLAPHTKNGRPIPIERLLKPQGRKKDQRHSFDELDQVFDEADPEKEKANRAAQIAAMREARMKRVQSKAEASRGT